MEREGIRKPRPQTNEPTIDAPPRPRRMGSSAVKPRIPGVAAGKRVQSKTISRAREATDDRTTVGVGEHVQLIAGEAGIWNGVVASERYLWIAPATAGIHAVTFVTSAGDCETIMFEVVAPGIEFRLARALASPGQQGAGMVTEVQFLPFTVSFANAHWRESAGQPSGIQGYFETHRPPDHAPNPAWLPMGIGAADTAACWGFPAPWSAGSFEWRIAQRYRVAGESGDGHLIDHVTQHVAITNDGTTTISKDNAATTRTVGPPTAGPARGSATGFGDLLDVIGGIHPAIGVGIHQAAQMSGREQLLADIRMSINNCPKHLEKRLEHLTRQQIATIMSVIGNLLAAEVAILVLLALPDPTMASKVLAVALQGVLLVLAFHVAFTESVAAFHAALAWWKVIKDANGKPVELEKSTALFTDLIMHVVQALGAALQVAGIGWTGIRVPSGEVRASGPINPDRTPENPTGATRAPTTEWGRSARGLLDTAYDAGIPVRLLEDLPVAERGHLVAARAAMEAGDIQGAIAHFDRVEPRLGAQTTRTLEEAIAKRAGKTAPDVYRKPHATLPSGERIEPTAWGGELYHGCETPPTTVFEKGLAGRGNDTRLVNHIQQRDGSAFRGATKQVFFDPDGKTGAGSWAGADGWVYKIDGTPSFDVNASLYGRVKQPDGTYSVATAMRAEHEHAILASVPRERIVGAYPIARQGTKLTKGPFLPNPHYRAIK
jgi:hypothetical protein